MPKFSLISLVFCLLIVNYQAYTATSQVAQAAILQKHYLKQFPDCPWSARILAATHAQKYYPGSDGTLEISSKFTQRLKDFGTISTLVTIERALIKHKLPASYSAAIMKELATVFAFPIPQGHHRFGSQALLKRIAEKASGAKVISIPADRSVSDLIQSHWPAFTKLTPIQRYLVFVHVSEINPWIRPSYSYLHRGDTPLAKRADPGTELVEPQMLQYLYAIDASLRLVPADVQKSHAEVMQGEAIAYPIGQDYWRICLFHVPIGSPLLLPEPSQLAKAANPSHLKLSNAWIRDATVLAGLDPQYADLRGNDFADPGPLSAMKSLRVLRLDGNPITELTALTGMKLTRLDIAGTQVRDLSPVRGMALEHLVVRACPIADISVIKDMPLKHVDIHGTAVTDLSALKDKALAYLRLDIRASYSDFSPLSAVEKINDIPRDIWISEFIAAATIDRNAIHLYGTKKQVKKRAPVKVDEVKKPKKKTDTKTTGGKSKPKTVDADIDELDALLDENE